MVNLFYKSLNSIGLSTQVIVSIYMTTILDPKFTYEKPFNH
jgi:hypothetical protein